MKKRILALIMGLFIMSFTACKNPEDTTKNNTQTDNQTEQTTQTQEEEVRTIALTTGEGYFFEYNEDTYDTVIRATYPVVYVYHGDENKFPTLTKAFEDKNKSEREYQVAFIEENREYAMESYRGNEAYFYSFESLLTPYVRRADTMVTSILYSGYTYYGGVHGDSYLYGETFDTKTGKKLSLSDVVQDKEKLSDAVVEQLDIHWSDVDLNESADIRAIIEDESAVSWTMDYSGITIYFMPYSIGSYSTGIQTVTVSFAEYPDVVKDAYKKTPEAYGVELTNDTPFYYDVTGDGKVDEIIFSSFESEEGNDGQLSIYVNGLAYDEDNYFFGDAQATFIKNKDGKIYIYVELLRENDYRQTCVYDLSYGVKKIGEIDGGLKRTYHEGEDNIITQDALTDPKHFYLTQTTQMLSTVSGSKEYEVSANGLPQTNARWFTFEEEYMPTFTLLVDFEVEVYDEKEDKVTGTKNLITGEKVLYFGTDNEKYGLLQCEDGSICRVEYGFDEDLFQITVNGQILEEVFDGIIFAG